MKQFEIIKRFEQYIRYKASSPSGRLWLENYRQRRGLNTLILIVHFLQDEDWVNTTLAPEQETELYGILYRTTNRIFHELSLVDRVAN